jgi:hypothetical protein
MGIAVTRLPLNWPKVMDRERRKNVRCDTNNHCGVERKGIMKTLPYVVAAFMFVAATSRGAKAENEEQFPADECLVLGESLASADAAGIDFLCTLSCTFWNACRIRNLGRVEVCGSEPTGCNCGSFR